MLIRNLKSHEILGQAEEGSQTGPKDLYLLPEKMEVMGQNKQINQPNKKNLTGTARYKSSLTQGPEKIAVLQYKL